MPSIRRNSRFLKSLRNHQVGESWSRRILSLMAIYPKDNLPSTRERQYNQGYPATSWSLGRKRRHLKPRSHKSEGCWSCGQRTSKWAIILANSTQRSNTNHRHLGNSSGQSPPSASKIQSLACWTLTTDRVSMRLSLTPCVITPTSPTSGSDINNLHLRQGHFDMGLLMNKILQR